MKNNKFLLAFSTLCLASAMLVGCTQAKKDDPVEPKVYTAQFVNGSEVLQTYSVEEGKYATYTGETPAKQSTESEDFTFIGWDKDPATTSIVKDTTFTAQFEGTVHSYNVKFMNGDQVLQESTVNHGSYATYDGEIPTKESTAEKVYTFNGWNKNPSLTKITADTVFTAVFDESARCYTAKFIDGETTLQTSSVAYGQKAVYSGEQPTKPADDEHRYQFSGWLPSLETEIRSDTTFVAQFVEKSLYQVSYDFNDLAEGQHFGDWVAVKDGENTYIVGTGSTWTSGIVTDYLYDDELTTISSNWEMSAKIYIEGNSEGNLSFVSDSIYEKDSGTFNKFLQWHTTGGNGYVQSYKNSTDLVDGDLVMDCGWFTMHGVGTDDNIASIVHNNWVDFKVINLGGQVSILVNNCLMGKQNLDVNSIKDIRFRINMGDLNAKVRLDDFVIKAVTSYDVSFKNGENVLYSYKVQDGEKAIYVGDEPTKTGEAGKIYTFDGWEPSLDTEVHADTVFNAKFNEEDRKVKATFKNGDTILQESDVFYGTKPSYTGEKPVKESSDGTNYMFIGWTPEIGSITADTVYQAKYLEYTDKHIAYDFENYYLGETFGDFKVAGDDTNKYIEASGSGWIEPKVAQLYNGELSDINNCWEMTANIYLVGQYAGNIDFISNSIFTAAENTTNKFCYLHSNPGNAFMQSYTNSTNLVDGDLVSDFGWLTMHGVGTDATIASILHDNWNTIKVVNFYNNFSVYFNDCLMGSFTKESNKLEDLRFAIYMGDAAATVRLDNFNLNVLESVKATFKNGDAVLEEDIILKGTAPEYKGSTPTKESSGGKAYVFDGWDKDITLAIDEDTVYTATFKESDVLVHYQFKNGDSVLQENDIVYNTAPVYIGETPTKESSDGKNYQFIRWEPAVGVITEDTVYNPVFLEYSDSVFANNFENYLNGQSVGDFTVAGDSTNKYIEASGSGWIEPKIAPLYNGELTSLNASWEMTADIYLVGQYAGNIDFISDSIFTAVENTTNKFCYLHSNPGNAYMQSYTNSTNSSDGDLISDFGWLTMHGVGTDATIASILHDNWNSIKVTKIANSFSVYFNDCLMGSFTKESNKLEDLRFAIYMGDSAATVRLDNFSIKLLETVKATFKNGDVTLQEDTLLKGSTPSYVGATPTKPSKGDVEYVFNGWDTEVAAITTDTVYNATFLEKKIMALSKDFEDLAIDTTVGDFLVKGDETNKYIEASGSGWIEPKIAPLYNGELTSLNASWEMTADIYLVGQYAGNIDFISDSIFTAVENTTNKFCYLHSNPGNAYMQSYTNSTNSSDGDLISDFGWLTMHGVGTDATIGSILHDNWNTIKVRKLNNEISIFFNDCLMGSFTKESNMLEDLSFAIYMGDPSAAVRLDNFNIKVIDCSSVSNNFNALTLGTSVDDFVVQGDDTNKYLEASGSGWVSPKKVKLYKGELETLKDNWELSADIYLVGQYAGNIDFISDSIFTAVENTTNKFCYLHSNPGNAYMQSYTNSTNSSDGDLISDFGWLTMHGVGTDATIGSILHDHWNNIKILKMGNTFSVYFNNFLMGSFTKASNNLEDISFAIYMGDEAATVRIDNVSLKTFSY